MVGSVSGLQPQWDQRGAEVSWKMRGGGQRAVCSKKLFLLVKSKDKSTYILLYSIIDFLGVSLLFVFV